MNLAEAQKCTLRRAPLLPIDEAIAETWALLNFPTPLPLVDGLLAATAIVYGLMLVTRNWGVIT